MRLAVFTLLTLSILGGCPLVAYGQFGFMPYGGYYASTAGEGYAIGMADMVRSAGMATLMTSKAAVNAQEAGSMYLDNVMKSTQGYIDRQRMLQSYQDSLRKPPPTSEQLYRMAQIGLPQALSASQLDPVSGKIAWPVVLRDEAFESYRKAAEGFFHDATAKPEAFSYDSYNQFLQTSNDCLADLKSRIKDYRPNDYIQAKKFIESLTYAAQHM
jgi:hypothetical protein